MEMRSNQFAAWIPNRFEPISRIEPPDPPRHHTLSDEKRREIGRRIRETLSGKRNKK